MKRIILVIFLALFCALTSFAQTAPADDKATVYVYKNTHEKTLWRAAFPVYCDNKLLAKLDGGRYFVARLPPGTHSFRSKNKTRGGVEVEMKAGEVYYLRLVTDTGVTVGNPRIVYPPKEEGAFDVKQMKPINSGDIKDRSVVETAYPQTTQ